MTPQKFREFIIQIVYTIVQNFQIFINKPDFFDSSNSLDLDINNNDNDNNNINDNKKQNLSNLNYFNSYLDKFYNKKNCDYRQKYLLQKFNFIYRKNMRFDYC